MKTMIKKKTRVKKQLETIGWREWLGLPDFGVSKIRVKVDTGAKTSALHVSHIRQREGSRYIRFKVHPNQEDRLPEYEVRAKVIEYRHVKSSNGIRSLRPVIQTRIRLGENEFPIELTLVNRDLMGFRMLLGREAIRKRYLVDCGQSFVQEVSKRKKKKKKKSV